MTTARALACILALFIAGAAHARPEAGRARALIEQADAAFQQGARLIAQDNAAGKAELARSARLFEQAMDEGGFRNAHLYFNIGNAHLLRDDAASAVLAYRRAERLRPADPAIRSALSAARARVGSTEPDAASGALSALLGWLRFIPPGPAFMLACIGSALAWTLAGARLFRPASPALWWGVGAAAAVSLASLGAALAAQRTLADADDAVVTATVTGRKGPDEAVYQPSFTEPLRAGVECRIVERRPGWALVRLADQRETWLPDHAIETVSLPR